MLHFLLKLENVPPFIHLTSYVDYGKTAHVTPSTAGGDEGGSNFNQIQMQMQTAQQLQQGGEVQQEQRELSFSCSSSGAETQDYPACRSAISQMTAFQSGHQGFNAAMQIKMKSANQKRVEKLKCQQRYLQSKASGEKFEMGVARRRAKKVNRNVNGGCAEYVTSYQEQATQRF